MPDRTVVRTVPVFIPLRAQDKFVLCFALFPSCAVFPDDKIIGGMKYTQVSSRCARVIEFDGRRLIVVLQHIRVVLELIDSCEFNAMTFELDGDAHFPRWVTT